MRKMMMIVTAVFSLAGCAVDPQEDVDIGDLETDGSIEQEEEGAKAASDVPVIEDTEVEPVRCTKSGTCPAEETDGEEAPAPDGSHARPDVSETLGVFVPKLCYWHSECPSNVCDLATRTCRDYPF